MSRCQTEASSEEAILELVIVGGGPQGLALLLRLLDDAPDESGDFFVGLGSAPRGSRQSCHDLEKKRCSRETADAMLSRIKVVDASGMWLGQWKQQFAALEIPHLRSTYDQHPCPYDSFALQQFVEKFDRQTDVVDLDEGGVKDCGCEKSGCGFRGNFRLPSTLLFENFVDHLIDQYPGVRDCVQRGRVDRVEPDGDLVKVVVEGKKLMARRVVLALGPSAAPQLPDWFHEVPGLQHAWDVVRDLKVTPGHRLAIVGGGLTSAHLAFVAEKRRAKVTLITRRQKLRISQYDLDLGWLGWRTRPGKIASYLSKRASPKDRLKMFRAARNGGSVSPEAKKALDASSVAILQDVDIVGAEIDDDLYYLIDADGTRLGPYDKVWVATGGAPGIGASPLFQHLLQTKPIPLEGEYPVLHASLRWDLGTPIYVVGAAAALTLGPDALNLAGTRMSSCRVASVFRQTLRSRCIDSIDAHEAFDIERDRARRLEELVVDFIPKKGTVVVRGRPNDAAKGTRRKNVQKQQQQAPTTSRRRRPTTSSPSIKSRGGGTDIKP